MAMGVSFLPGGGDNGQRNKPPTEPLQQAIQMLSLRLPQVAGAQGIAPGPLLQSPGGGGIMELLAQLFGQGHMGQQQPGMAGMAGAGPMAPAVHPGTGAPQGGAPLPGAGRSPGGTLPGPLPNEPAPGTFHPGGYDPGPTPQAAPQQGYRPPVRDWNIGPRNY